MSSELDIMSKLDSVDLSTVQTDFPLLKSGIVTAQIVTVEPDNVKGCVVIKYTLTQDWSDVEGKAVKPGFPFSEFIYLQDWEDPKTGEVKNFGVQRLAQLREAIYGKAAPGTKLALSELAGQTVTVRLNYNPAPTNKKTGEVYGPQTSVVGYVKAKK